MGDTGGFSHIYTKNAYNYHHSPLLRSLIIRLAGRSLVWVEGEKEHKRMRSVVAPAFSSDNIREMHADIYLVATALQTRIENEIHASDKSSIQVNILDYTSRATMDIIGRVAFGHDFNAVGDAPDVIEIARLWRTQNEMSCKHSAFISTLVLRLFPSITSLPLPNFQAQVAVSDTIRNLAKDMVANSQVDNKGSGKDLMSLLLQANARQHKSKRPNMPEIYDHIVTFMYAAIFCSCRISCAILINFLHSLAGNESTSLTLGFTTWALAQHPDIQTKLREEARTIAGEPTYDDLMDPNRLPYLDAVCKEAMRMFPAGPRTEKIVEEDDVIPLRDPIRGADGSWIKSIPVKKGQVIHIPLIGINRDEAVFGDADVFRPTRWLVGRGDATEAKYCTSGEHGIPPSEHMCRGWSGLSTFSEGPRICVGMKLALFEYKAILTILVRSFRFHDTGVAISMFSGTTLSPHVKGREYEGINLPVKLTLI